MNLGAQLQRYLQAFAGEPFAWRDRNCTHFLRGWVLEQEGFDILAGLPQVPSQHGALRLIRALGATLYEAANCRLQRPAIAPALARMGDPVLMPFGPTQALGICNGRVAAFLARDGSIAHFDMQQAQHAWRLHPC